MNFENYCNYFYNNKLKDNLPLPGEHHFVAIYIIPTIQQCRIQYKDIEYVNPDGTKRLLGDVKFGNCTLEIKYSKNRSISFTKNQMLLLKRNEEHPTLIIAICKGRDKKGQLVKFNLELLVAKAQAHYNKEIEHLRDIQSEIQDIRQLEKEMKGLRINLDDPQDDGICVDLSEKNFRKIITEYASNLREAA